MVEEKDLIISEKNYQRTRLVIDTLRRFLKVNIKLHNHIDQFEKGDIFLFNHFARFETFLPQYLIFEATGLVCRSLAAPELFTDDAFGKYLLSIGAIPTNLQDVIHFLACEINRGYKTIIFPEGAMIKNRRVMGPRGRFRIYSRDMKAYRKPHTGAAVIALYTQNMRDLFLLAHERKNQKRLDEIATMLHADNLDHAIEIASQPVRIVPANITFHPLRGDDNFLSKVAERLGKVKNERMEEELIIEGNILFKDTDMDIRLGEPIMVQDFLSRTDWYVLRSRYHLRSEKVNKGLASRMLTRIEMIRSEILSERIMVDYMKSIYSLITVNIAHLCAEMIYQLLQRYKQREVSIDFFARVLYFTIKKLQISPGVFLHRGLLNPDRYDSLLYHANRDLRDFFFTAIASGLVKEKDDCYLFLPALEKEYEFDEIRIRNFIKVRHNETRPIPTIEQSVHEVFTHFDQLNSPRSLAAMFYDDDKKSHERDRSIFCKRRYDEINQEESQTLAGDPFFLVPEQLTPQKVGVLLIHGFTASPAEMRPLGDFLCEKGLYAYGVRLKGHGTSPCDLDFRSGDQWYRSVLRGWDVLQHSCEKIFVAGFSMGGCLALKLAMEKGNEIAGVISIATSLRIRNKNIIFANLINQINKLVGSLPYVDGIKRFKKGNSENPEINYLNIPISAIQEFKKLMDQTEKCLDEVYQPILIIQGADDPTVDPISAELIAEGISSQDKKLLMVDSDRHVIVLDKGSLVHQEIFNFITALTKQGQEERVA